MSRTSKQFDIQPVVTERGLESLRDEWTELLNQLPDPSLFLTWEWMRTWWRHFGGGRSLYVLTARSADGQLAGIAPWMLEKSRLGLGAPAIQFLGAGIVGSDHLDVIAPQNAPAICGAFLGHIRTALGGAGLLLYGLRTDSLLKRYLATEPGWYSERDGSVCPYLELPDSWERYEQETLSSNRRQQLRRRRRQLERAGQGRVQFSYLTEPRHLETDFSTLVTLNRARWATKEDETSFHSDRFVSFHREMAELALKRGWLRLFQLKVGEEVVGVHYCFAYRNEFYDYQRGFRPEWSEYSPGHLLFAYVVQTAIAEGAARIDMLRGEESYKASWATHTRRDASVIYTEGKYHLLGLSHRWNDLARRHGKRILPQPIRRFLERAIARRQQE